MLIILTVPEEIFHAGACPKLACLLKNCPFKTNPAPFARELWKKMLLLLEWTSKQTPVTLCLRLQCPRAVSGLCGRISSAQWNLPLPDSTSSPCLHPAPLLPAHTVPPSSIPAALPAGEASESRNVIHCNVVATETAVIQCRDKLVLVLSMTLKAGQAIGSRQTAECGEKKRPCMCPWRQWKDSGKDSNDMQKLFYLGVLLLWVELLKCVLGQQLSWTFAERCSPMGCCVNPQPEEEKHELPSTPALLLFL